MNNTGAVAVAADANLRLRFCQNFGGDRGAMRLSAEGRMIGKIGKISMICLLVGMIVGGVPTVGPARAQSLESLLPSLLKDHDRLKARQADVRAAKQRAREALGGWYPILEPKATHGYEYIRNPHDDNTSLPLSEVELSLTQLLWDFGATNAAVEKARLELADTEVQLTDARQDLIQEAVEAYVNLLRAHKTLKFAAQSKQNIQKQTGLEEARVETGSGLSSDVLQAKQKLAGAVAREIGGQGTLISAINRFKAVFDHKPDVERLVPVKLPTERLPKSLDSAVALAKKSNADLILDRLSEAIARRDVRSTYGEEFFPKIEGIVEQKWKNNSSGTTDLKREFLAKVELSMSINLGLTQINTLRAAQSDVVAASRTVADTMRTVVEDVGNAWQELHTARATAASLRTQADITGAFLALARQERQLGQRTLIEVLSSETDLINAQSDMESAEADVLVAAYKLLNVTGQLTPVVFKSGRRSPLPTPTAMPTPTPAPAPRKSPPAASDKAGGVLDSKTILSTAKPTPAETAAPPSGETSPWTTPPVDPAQVSDDTLNDEAVKPFKKFFGDVQTIFTDALKANEGGLPRK